MTEAESYMTEAESYIKREFGENIPKRINRKWIYEKIVFDLISTAVKEEIDGKGKKFEDINLDKIRRAANRYAVKHTNAVYLAISKAAREIN